MFQSAVLVVQVEMAIRVQIATLDHSTDLQVLLTKGGLLCQESAEITVSVLSHVAIANLIAFDENESIGVLSLFARSESELWMCNVVSLFRSGIFAASILALTRTALRFAQAHGFSKFVGDPRSSDSRLMRLYEILSCRPRPDGLLESSLPEIWRHHKDPTPGAVKKLFEENARQPYALEPQLCWQEWTLNQKTGELALRDSDLRLLAPWWSDFDISCLDAPCRDLWLPEHFSSFENTTSKTLTYSQRYSGTCRIATSNSISYSLNFAGAAEFCRLRLHTHDEPAWTSNDAILRIAGIDLVFSTRPFSARSHRLGNFWATLLTFRNPAIHISAERIHFNASD
jgi:hypothetical protein